MEAAELVRWTQLDEESEKAWVGCVQDHQMHQSMAVHPLTFRSDS